MIPIMYTFEYILYKYSYSWNENYMSYIIIIALYIVADAIWSIPVNVLPVTRILYHKQGAVSIRKTVLPGMAIPMLKIRRPNGRLIFIMEIAICR